MLCTAVSCIGLHGIVTRDCGKPATCCQKVSAQTPASRPLLPQELCPGPGSCPRVIGIDGCYPDTADPPALVPRRKWAEHSSEYCSVRQGMCGTHFALVFQNWCKFLLTMLTQQCMARHNIQYHPVGSIVQHCTAFRLLEQAELTVYLDVCRTQ